MDMKGANHRTGPEQKEKSLFGHGIFQSKSAHTGWREVHNAKPTRVTRTQGDPNAYNLIGVK